MRSASWRSSSRSTRWPDCRQDVPVVGMIPVHVGGLMMNIDEINAFASRHGSGSSRMPPTRFRRRGGGPTPSRGSAADSRQPPSRASPSTPTRRSPPVRAGWRSPPTPSWRRGCGCCRCTACRTMPGTGIRETEAGTIASSRPGYKYNMTDIAAAIGIHQLARAEGMRRAREAIALEYRRATGRHRRDRAARHATPTVFTRGISFRSGCASMP